MVINIVNRSSRLQPVMIPAGQAAGIIASLEVGEKVNVEDVEVRKVQDVVIVQGGYIMPYWVSNLIPRTSRLFKR
ncbi:MAG: hypothetical protein ACI9FN_003585 [Saprospiraceae bacterium]|jgi:hypothetical protein